MKIFYDVPLVKQGLSECTQASVTQLLNYYGISKTIEEVKKEVPVYVSPEGKPVGTSLGHMGCYLLQQGFHATIHIVDVEIFDRSWKGLHPEQLVQKLQERKQFIQHARYGKEAFDLIFDGYISFIKKGGAIELPVIDEAYLVKQLENGPFLAVVSYNFLHSDTKYRYDKETNTDVRDDIKGNPTTHAIVVSGFNEGKFSIVDPDKENGGKKDISASQLIGAIYLAETDFDSLILTLHKK